MFEVIVNLQPVGTYKSFNEAFIKFFEGIDTVLKAGTSYQWLETANFLVRNAPSEPIGVMTFYDARDCAYDIGLLDEGKIQEGVDEPAPDVISDAFKACAEKREVAEMEQLVLLIEQMLKLMVEQP